MRFLKLILISALLVSCTSGREGLSNKYVIKVEGEGLAVKDFAATLAHRLRSFDSVAAKNPERIKRVKDQILTEFINQVISRRWASENKIKISEDEINAESARIRKSYPDELSFNQALASENLTSSTFKQKIKDALIERALVKTLQSKVADPTEDELKSYYKSNAAEFKEKAAVRLRQIFIEKEDDARQLQAKANGSRDISELAKKYSTAPEASRGGDLGWIEKGAFETFDKAFTMTKGAVSGVLKSPFGYHILQVVDKRSDSQLKFADVKDKIRANIRSDREQATYSAWLESQVRHLKVLRNEELINSISVETKR